MIPLAWATLYALTAAALPCRAQQELHQVVAGSATLERTENTLSITASDRLIAEWNTFNVAQHEAVRFVQPSASSVALNRILDSHPSEILGSLQANGQIFLLNPNGILFGPDATVNVGGLLATTLDLSNDDFLAGRYSFGAPEGSSPSFVMNLGELRAEEGGFVGLLGSAVDNQGLIEARLGSVMLGSAQTATLSLSADGLVSIALEGAVLDSVAGPDGNALTSAIGNSGTILADGGRVVLSAETALGLFETVVHQSGLIQAHSFIHHGGVVELVGGSAGTVGNSGMIDASSAEPGASGGAVTLAGRSVLHEGLIRATGNDEAPGGEVTLQSVEQTVLASGSLVDSSGAGNDSAGGSILLWSDGDTHLVAGSALSARGGTPSGDGGWIELSGKGALELRGDLSVAATQGKPGTLLFDPVTLVVSSIDDADGASLGDVLYADFPLLEPWNVSPSQLDLILGNIILQAHDNIQVNSPVVLGTPGATLTLQAGDDILITANITTSSGNVSMTSNDPGGTEANSGFLGEILMADGTTINVGNANITMSAQGTVSVENLTASGVSNTISLTSTDGSIARTSLDHLISSSGTVSLTAFGGIGTSGSPILTSTVNLSADKGTGAGGVFIQESSSVTLTGTFRNQAAGGELNLTATSGSINTGSATVSSSGGLIRLNARDLSATNATPDGITVGPGGISSSGGLIELLAADDIAITGNVDAGTGTVTIRSDDDASDFFSDTDGAITGSATATVSGGTVQLFAQEGIGTLATPLRTATTTLQADNDATAGDLAITEANDVTLSTTFRNLFAGGQIVLGTTDGSINSSTVPVSSNDGAITFDARDASTDNLTPAGITIGTGSVSSVGGPITLRAADDISITGIVSVGPDDLFIEADFDPNDTFADTDGAITGASGATLIGNNVTLRAQEGIGTVATPVETSAITLTADNGPSGGNVVVSESSDVTLATTFRNQALAGQLILTTTNGSIDSSSVAVSTNGGPIQLGANDTTADNSTSGRITIGSGGLGTGAGAAVIALYAADDISIAGNINSGGGNITIVADATIVGTDTFPDTDGAITRTGSATVTAAFGDGEVHLRAEEGIGTTATPILTAALKLEADNGPTAGEVVITEADDVTLLSIFRNRSSGGLVRLETTDGSIDTSTAAVSTNNGPIILDARDASADNSTPEGITVGAGGIRSGGSMITLLAADDISIGGDVDAGSSDLTITADADGNDTFSDEDGAITASGTPTLRGNLIRLRAPEGIQGDFVLESSLLAFFGSELVAGLKLREVYEGLAIGNRLTTVALEALPVGIQTYLVPLVRLPLEIPLYTLAPEVDDSVRETEKELARWSPVELRKAIVPAEAAPPVRQPPQARRDQPTLGWTYTTPQGFTGMYDKEGLLTEVRFPDEILPPTSASRTGSLLFVTQGDEDKKIEHIFQLHEEQFVLLTSSLTLANAAQVGNRKRDVTYLYLSAPKTGRLTAVRESYLGPRSERVGGSWTVDASGAIEGGLSEHAPVPPPPPPENPLEGLSAQPIRQVLDQLGRAAAINKQK